MYSKNRAASIAKNDVKFIGVGINDDVMLKEAKCELSPNNNYFLEIVFEKNGATLVHTEWEPSLNAFTTTQDQLQQKADNQYSRMLQILRCFYKDEEIDFNGESFRDFAKYVVDMLNNADKTKKLKVKVVYNDKGYTSLPKYAKFTFIEPMELPEGTSSSIAILGIDTLIKPVVADKEAPVSNPLAGTTTVEDSKDDLPF